MLMRSRCLRSNPFKHMGNSKGGYGKGAYGRGKGGKGMPAYPMFPGMYPGGMRPQGMFGMPPMMGGRGVGPYGQPMAGLPMNSLMYRSSQLQMMHQVRSHCLAIRTPPPMALAPSHNATQQSHNGNGFALDALPCLWFYAAAAAAAGSTAS